MRQSEITGEMELPQSFARTISSLEHMTSETTRQDILGAGVELAAAGQEGEAIRSPAEETVFSLRDVGVAYGPKRAISGITLNMPLQRGTARIRPYVVGKATP